MLKKLFAKPEPRPVRRRAQVPEGLRVYAIGDIHGQTALLDSLHGMIEEDAVTRPAAEIVVVYLGDYVDRGPDSKGVLDRLAVTPSGIRRVLLKGNHEVMMQRFLADPVATAAWRDLGGLETLLSYRVDPRRAMSRAQWGEAAREFAQRVPPEHVALLESMPFSVTLGDYFFCHAGVKPGVPLERQSERDLMWIRDEFLGSDCDFGKVIVHGHTPAPAVEFRPNRINIDTGAYATGRLTCLVLEGSEQLLLQT